MSEQIFYMLSGGDSYNGVHATQIFNNLEDCTIAMNKWLIYKCSQSYCTITKHIGFKKEQIIYKQGTNKPENPWD